MQNEFEQPLKNSNKNIIIIASFLIVIILLGVGAFFMFKNKKADVAVLVPETKQEDPLLKDNKDAIDEAMNAENKTVRKIDDTDHILGDINAPVQVIVYDDFDNQFSADYFLNLKRVKESFGEKVVIALRPFPMRSHQYAVEAALASECASEQNYFWEMAEKMYAAKGQEKLDAENMILIAEQSELDNEKFLACLEKNDYLDKIQASITEADKFNVTGVPTTFINGVPYPGAYQFDDFVDSTGQERKGLGSIIGVLVGN